MIHRFWHFDNILLPTWDFSSPGVYQSAWKHVTQKICLSWLRDVSFWRNWKHRMYVQLDRYFCMNVTSCGCNMILISSLLWFSTSCCVNFEQTICKGFQHLSSSLAKAMGNNEKDMTCTEKNDRKTLQQHAAFSHTLVYLEKGHTAVTCMEWPPGKKQKWKRPGNRCSAFHLDMWQTVYFP